MYARRQRIVYPVSRVVLLAIPEDARTTPDLMAHLAAKSTPCLLVGNHCWSIVCWQILTARRALSTNL